MKNHPLTKFAKANFSTCGRYRYSLHKSKVEVASLDNLLLWIMLNPSKATEHEDDPTVRKCQEFSYRWGFCGAVIANLYGIRSTDPKPLRTMGYQAATGPGNDWILDELIGTYHGIMVAWGSEKIKGIERRIEVVDNLAQRYKRNLYCLHVNKDGNPKHPLYCSYSSTRKPWRMYGAEA